MRPLKVLPVDVLDDAVDDGELLAVAAKAVLGTRQKTLRVNPKTKHKKNETAK